MELYILDDQLRRVAVIDWFESLIWAEKITTYGDLELQIVSTNDTRRLLVEGTRVMVNESHRIMTIENVENSADSEGRLMLKATGRSLESVLLDRVAKNTLSNLTTEPKWILNETARDGALKIFLETCVTSTLDPGDIIPEMSVTPGPTTIFAPFLADTVPYPPDTLVIEFEPTSVYDVIKQLCDTYRMGFRLVLNPETNKLHFNVFTGRDLTSQQAVYPPVIFSPHLDNLQGITSLKSIQNVKNVAYVFSKNGYKIVYADGVDSSISGLKRKVMHVKVDSDLAAGTALDALLEQKGREELSKHRALAGFDGEIPQYEAYKYGVDYQLGDTVEMRTEDGYVNYMRVSEQIFVSDSEGDRSYPTLTVDIFVEPGSWLARGINETWETTDGEWADQV